MGSGQAGCTDPLPVQSADNVPPKSLARDMAFAKLQSRILSAAEAVQASKLHGDVHPEQQAIMLNAGRPGTGTCWTAMHKSPTELSQSAPWRVATALRLGATPVAGPRSTCAVRKGNDGDMCEHVLATHPFHLFCCKYGGARARPHRAVQHTLRRLIEQAGSYADLEPHVSELYDWVSGNNEAAPKMRCAILDVVSWFPGVLATKQLWIDVSVRCPHAERQQRKCVETRGGCSRWRSGEDEALWYGRAMVGLRDLWKTGRRRHQVAARFGGNGGGERTVQPACCRTMEDPAGTSTADCTSRHVLASAGIQSCRATCC